MSIVLFLSAAVGVGVALFAPAWRHLIAARFDYVSGRVRRAAGRWQARDIQRGVVKAVARNAMVTLNGAYLWNRVEVALAPEDFGHVRPFLTEFAQEIEGLIRQLVERRPSRPEVVRYKLASDPEVRVTSDSAVMPGTLKVEGSVRRSRRLPARAPAPLKTAIMSVQSETPRPVLWLGGSTKELRHDMVIGRDRDADFRVQDRRVSRRHACVRIRENEVWLEDLGSSHGTRVNGKPIEKPVRLASGDRISLADAPAGRFAFDQETVAL
ncbi:MAG: FHA domain-containing protein [Actinomycetota bacterium]|nr:FHA domain-containing protein [Actinomycetota bacterium]